MDNRKHKKARTEVDDNVALVAALRAQIAKLEQECTKHKQECTKHKQECTKHKQDITINSMLSVLPGKAQGCIPQLKNRGTVTSHTAPKNTEAEIIKKKFIVPDVVKVCCDLGVDLNRSSSLRTKIRNKNNLMEYENEYDVQSYVEDSLHDATYICNGIIKKLADQKKISARIVLSVRSESSMFSNILDHAVVFNTVSGAPVFSIETKKPWGRLTKKVYGQVYDQLREMQAKGHPNPFGALTCFDKTYIFWLDNDKSQAVLHKLENDCYSTGRLGSIVGNLPPDSPVPTEHTQSPAKETIFDKQYDGENTGFTLLEPRELSQSYSIESEGMIAAFVSAIICSLDGFQNPREIKSFEKDKKVEVEALCLNSESHEWGTLRTVYKGPKKKEPTWKQWDKEDFKNLYLVDHLGTGSTSKVYRALTKNGYDCVVKMYVQRRDANKIVLSKKDFKRNANRAVKEEVKMLKKMYKELENYVWKQTFQGVPCVIHPYFRHLHKSERKSMLPTIKERLLECFSTNCHFYAFASSDQAWRHVGYFNEQLYLFDLADLKKCEIAKRNELVDEHIGKLRGKIGEE